jgi:hypothetical protein
MSYVTVEEFKLFARVFTTDDDALIATLIEAAEDEACRFLNRTELPTLPLEYPSGSETEEVPSSNDDIAPSVRVAIYLLTQSKYEAITPDDVMKLRKAAETLLFPYRAEMGV